MACPAVVSGERFLGTVLAHVDCQAQGIGRYGWGALADPSSTVSIALLGLLTVFVAIFGIRMMLGLPQAPGELVDEAVKVGIVLTLATSWPAWRIVGYDLVIHGAREVAELIGSRAGLPTGAGDLTARLQNVDRGLASLNVFGSGRLGVAQGDWLQLGTARLAYLAGVLFPLAVIWLAAGILLALAPLMAGLLLFSVTRGIFDGWIRALFATFLASIMVTVLLSAEVSLLEPWLINTLQRRASNLPTLDAPVEVVAITASFCLAALVSMLLAIRVAFQPLLHFRGWQAARTDNAAETRPTSISRRDGAADNQSRAQTITTAIAENLRREERMTDSSRRALSIRDSSGRAGVPSPSGRDERIDQNALGDSWRRSSRRQSSAHRLRDQNR